MLTVNVLGHTHITYKGNLVPLSAKAVALITYLALERLPQHRERLADLLWSTAEARKNLRVELARIRSAGLDIFPRSRQLLYLEHVTTDLEVWRSRLNSGMDQPELAHWLAMLRGLPLSGMEDLGSTALQEWVDQQRCTLEEQVEQVLETAHHRFLDDNKVWATRIIQARAAALGYHLDVPVVESTRPAARVDAPGRATLGVPERPMVDVPDRAVPCADEPEDAAFEEERALAQALERARVQPQVMVVHGPLGSGKSYLTERALQAQDWQTVRVRSTRLSRLVIASVAQELSRLVEAADAEALRRLLLHPGSLEEDTVKLATILANLPNPVALVLDHTQSAPVELASLLEFILLAPCRAPRAVVLLSRTPPAKSPLARSFMRRLDPGQCTAIEMQPLTVRRVEHILRDRAPGRANVERAAELLQRSEGNVLHLLSLLEQERQVTGHTGQRVPGTVREQYAGEIDGWPEPLRDALGCLSVINGDFDLELMRAALDAPSAAFTQSVLREALERTCVTECEPDVPLLYPALTPPAARMGASGRYTFRSEGLRVSVAGSVPHEQRQAVRRRLAAFLEQDEPGLALYYAERIGPDPATERLSRAYHARLPLDSPLQAAAVGHYSDPMRLTVPVVQTPPRLSRTDQASATWQGYTLSRGDGGWLSIVSHGRSGHPHTLRLHVPLPPGTGEARSVRLVWRLEFFQGGADLGPLRAPFALRVHRAGDPDAHVFTPDVHREYVEDGLRHLPHPDLGAGIWMAHRVTLPPARTASELLELSVRGLDVALTIGQLEIDGVELLGTAQAQGTPLDVPTVRPVSRLN